MRALQAAVVIMGVLIVVGVAVLGVTIVHRLGTPAMRAAAVLDEPAGTRMAGISGVGDRFALLLQGGGPDRVVLLDGHSGQVVGRVALGR